MKGKPPNTIPPTRLEVYIPADIRARMDLHLYSSVEGRVPHGAYKKFLCELIREFFAKQDKSQGAPN